MAHDTTLESKYTGITRISGRELDKKDGEAKLKVNLKYLRDKDREPVKGIFRYHEVPNGLVRFPFRKHKGDPIESYELHDGQVYTLPLGVAKHLNNNTWYPVHKYATDETGKPTVAVGQKVRRMSFQSLEFVDIDEFPVDLVTVEKVSPAKGA